MTPTMTGRKKMLTTEEVLAPVPGGNLDYLMVTPSLVPFPDPANRKALQRNGDHGRMVTVKTEGAIC